MTYCTVLRFSTLIWFLEISKLKTEMTTLLYCTVLYSMVLYHTVLYCTILYTVTSLADTHLLIKQFMLGPLDKKFSGWVVGGIAIIASSSRGPGEI